MNIKSILFKRSRFLKRGIYPARELVAVKTVPLGEVLKWMDFDRFHMIYMLDEDLRFLQMITEQQIVDGLMKYNADMTLEELIRAGEGPSV